MRQEKMSRNCIVIDRAIALLLSIALVVPVAGSANEAEERLEQVRHDPVALRRFLYRFPKGGDLHNHLDGAIYAENYIAWAAEDGKCVELSSHFIVAPPCDADAGRPPVSQVRFNADLVNPLIDALSVRNYERRPVSGHNQFFSTFRRFYQASLGREGDMLAEAAARAARQNTMYLELMQSWGMPDARAYASADGSVDLSQPLARLADDDAIKRIARDVIAMTDRAEARWREKLLCGSERADPGCGMAVRYLAQVIRVFPRELVFAQTLLAFRLIEADPRYVGLNFVAPEDNPVTLRDYRWQMELIGGLAQLIPAAAGGITLHAGELALGLVPPEQLGWHIRDAVEIAGARRIGHGVDIAHDMRAAELLRHMARQQILVEINLTSNDVILGVSGADHPFELYREFAVPLALSTDDEGVSRIDLTHEYQRAVETFDLTYAELQDLSRNALEYSFLAGASLFHSIGEHRIVDACAESVNGTGISAACEKFLDASDKASLQWQLERRFAEFEASLP